MIEGEENTLMFRTLILATVTAAAALAGPPLVCHRIETGDAKSLPWRNVRGWDGTDPAYNVANLAADTLQLLGPATPLNVRRETLRRAAIYSAKEAGLAARITARLQARAEAAPADPLPWFDAGYFAESVRQTAMIYHFDMLDTGRRKQWSNRGDGPQADGLPWIEKAIRLGGKGMEPSLAMIREYRDAFEKSRFAKQVAGK